MLLDAGADVNQARTNEYATTVKYNTSYKPGNIAIGMNTLTTGESSISIGSNAAGNGGSATSIGYNSDATGNGATALGAYAQAVAIGAVAIGGAGQDPTSSNNLQGQGADAEGQNSVAIGKGSTAIGYGSVAINGTARGSTNNGAADISSVAVGNGAIINPNAFGGVAIGDGALCGYNSEDRKNAIAIGAASSCFNTGGIAIGRTASVSGGASNSNGTFNVAIGQQASVSGTSATSNSVALGYAASVTTANTIRLGNTSISSLLLSLIHI